MEAFLNSNTPIYITRPMPTEAISPEQLQQVFINNIRNQVAKQLEESHYAEAFKASNHNQPLVITNEGPNQCLTKTPHQLKPLKLQNTY